MLIPWIHSFVFAILFIVVAVFGQDSTGGNVESTCGYIAGPPKWRSKGVYSSDLGSTPWQVALYAMPGTRRTKWQFKCAGTILTPKIVITAASCVFNENIKKLLRPERLMVIAAKQDLTLNTEPDAQRRQVRSVHVKDTYEGEVNSQKENLAVLSISPSFEINDYIQPVCIDWNRKLSHDVLSISLRNQLMTGATWGLSKVKPVVAEQLEEGVFHFLNRALCLNGSQSDSSSLEEEFIEAYLTEDKFCIVTPSGRVKYDSGMGLVTLIRDRYFLQGVLSESIGDHLSVVTNVTNHYNWLKWAVMKAKEVSECKDLFVCYNKACIQPVKLCNGFDDCGDGSDESELQCGNKTSTVPSDGQCTLPTQRSGVKYTLTNKCKRNCDRQGGDRVNSLDTLTMQCGRGTAPADGDTFGCIEGKFYSKTPECIKLCHKLVKEAVDVKCEYNGKKTNCTDYMRPGTVATFNCKEYYHLKDSWRSYKMTTCNADGKWSRELPDCIPECGVPNKAVSGATPTVSFGAVVKQAFDFPWHVGLYGKNGTRWSQVCGGSLINPHLVLTAAHCLHDRDDSLLRLKPDDLIVAGGKLKRDFHDTEEHQQSSEIIDIIVRPTYSGWASSYSEDIGIVELMTPFVLTDYIRPICIKSGEEEQVPTTKATVVGWGFTEKNLVFGGLTGESSPILLKAEIPVISTIDCREIVKNLGNGSFFPFVTGDKFCGLYVNGSGPQSGDSGGGVIIREGPQWFVEGIISVKEPSNTLAVLTNVRVYRKFIQDTITSHRRHLAHVFG
ncbi:serine protease 1 [Nesidiocoris tenuis]|uniref:Serine protease 1 n=1 Tax=Nesidiocoris tenuis TaxID=355587 RepID=A0ABN7AWG4_9HEMI|nr:serine protease 1 [Nesidiocoris tenuis]